MYSVPQEYGCGPPGPWLETAYHWMPAFIVLEIHNKCVSPSPALMALRFQSFFLSVSTTGQGIPPIAISHHTLLTPPQLHTEKQTNPKPVISSQSTGFVLLNRTGFSNSLGAEVQSRLQTCSSSSGYSTFFAG